MRRRFTVLIAVNALIAGAGLTAGSASAVFLGPSTGLTAARDGQRLDVNLLRLRAGGREADARHHRGVQRAGPAPGPGPDAAAPRGKVGVWTDGGHRGALATRSASGAVIRLVDEGDGLERTNLLRFFSTPLLSVLVAATEPEPVA